MAGPLPLASRWSHLAQQFRNSPLIHPRTQEERNTRLLYLNTAIVGVPSGGVVAFLPVFLVRLGASSSMVGWLTSAPALLTILALIPAAMISERSHNQVKVRSRYAWYYQIAYLLAALAPFVVPAASLPLVLVALWTAKTFPEAVAIPSWMSVMARAVPPQRRARLNGTRWAMLSIVSAVSSAFFGWLLDSVAFPLNYQLVFLISFITAWFDPFFFSFIKVPPLPDAPIERAHGLLKRFSGYFGPVFSHKPFLTFIAITILYRVALNFPTPLFSLFWVNELHASEGLIGMRGLVGNAFLVVGYIFWGRSANKIGHRQVLFLAALGSALYPIVTGLSPSAWWLLPAAAIWGLTAAGIDIGLFDMMLAYIPERRQPLFTAVWSMVANVAIFIGPQLGAILSDATSLSMALIIAGIAQMITTIPFIALPRDV